MKKLFAIVFIMFFLLTSFNAQAEAADTNPNLDGKITLEFLNQMSSWEELVNTALPIWENSYNNIENKEDFYCIMLIKSIDAPMMLPIYHNEEYIKVGFGGIKLKEIDEDRLFLKYQQIINIYNVSNELQLVLESKILSENNMQFYVYSTNVIECENLATEVGQLVKLKAGTNYWESCYNNGSGNHNVISEDCVVTVNGVAYMDENWTNVVESYYKPYDELVEQEIVISKRRMLHVCTESTDLGWVYAEDALRVD